MAPKRKNNNNKKRRPKNDKATTPNLSPEASPSKPNSSSNHSASASPSKPTIHPSDKNHSIHTDTPAQNLVNNGPKESKTDPDHQPSHPSPVTVPDPSNSRPASNSKSDHHASVELSDHSKLPAKHVANHTSGKQALAVQRVQDNGGSSENSPDPVVHSKPETRQTADPPNKPSSNHHSAEKNSTQPQRGADRVLKEIVGHGNPLNGTSKPSEQPKLDHDKSDQLPPKPIEDTSKSHSHHSNHVKKPIKQVKFNNDLTNDQPPNTSTQENHASEQTGRQHANHESEKKSGSKNKQVPIRREMSGAADQFDFDAQQRQHAGPGGGMVKKPRHSKTNSIHSMGSNSTLGEPNQVNAEDSSPRDSHQEPTNPSKHGKGFKHAQRCLNSMVSTQTPDGSIHVNPDLFQIYLSYFDQNEDGLLEPFDTWKAFRRLGFGLIIATLATITLHAMMIPFVGVGSGLMPDTLGFCHLPMGHHLFESTRNIFNIVTNGLSRYVCVDRKVHHYPEKINPLILWKETREHVGRDQMTDPIGWIRIVFGWIIAVALTWPSDLTVKYDLIDGVYNGEILFLVAQGSS